MEFWASGEVYRDVGEDFRLAILWIESAVNEEIRNLDLKSNYRQWAFIAIILPSSMEPEFPERIRRHKKDNSLEFRLYINHGEFCCPDKLKQRDLILNALSRSVDLMSKYEVPEDDRAKLKAMLEDVRARSRAAEVPKAPFTSI